MLERFAEESAASITSTDSTVATGFSDTRRRDALLVAGVERVVRAGVLVRLRAALLLEGDFL